MDINCEAELTEAQHKEAEKAKTDEAYHDAHRKVPKKEDNFNFITTPTNREDYPYDKLTKTGQGQKAALKEDHDQYIIVIPFSAGPKFYQSYTILKQDVMAFLDSFQIEKENYRISFPSECLIKKVQDYQTLWPFFIKGTAPPLQNFLLWQQTFLIDEKLVLNFLSVNINYQSWIIAAYHCGAVENNTARIARAL
ncbi:hypothetical protein IW262DRAFT_1296204 [Armillaria fumosa]|nr:hypothetical protein IW262DRAFT_1296204 [Armillaria fumosa]